MTIVFRPASPATAVQLGSVGVCMVSLGVVVAAMGAGPWRVVFLAGAK